MSCIARKPDRGQTQTGLAVQPQKMARDLKFWIYEGHPISSDNDLIKQNLFLKDGFQ